MDVLFRQCGKTYIIKERGKNEFTGLKSTQHNLILFRNSTKHYSDCDYENGVCFNQSEEIKEYLYEGCSLEHPVGMIFSKYDFPKGKIK